jgi:serine/threonine-protein phosphatase 2B catalytic subunit
VQNKVPVTDIDFTIHAMEDGTEVSTQERVCKGIVFAGLYLRN